MSLLRKINESLFGVSGSADGESGRNTDSRSNGAGADRGAERDGTDRGGAGSRSGSVAESAAGAGDDSSASTPDERGGADVDTAADDEPVQADADTAADDASAAQDEEEEEDGRSHGLHWNTVLHPDDQPDDVPERVAATVEEGDVVERVDREGTDVTGYRLGDGSVGSVAVTGDEEVATAYPVVDGIEHDVALKSIDEWESGLEAWLEGRLADVELTAFAANYVAQSPADADVDVDVDADERSVSLALLAYNMGKAEYDTITTDSGDEIDVSDFVGIRPWEQGAADDYVVRTEVKEVEPVSAENGGYDGYVLRVPLFRMDDGAEFDVALFVADHVAGDYEPEVGDTVEGACWLQTWMQ